MKPIDAIPLSALARPTAVGKAQPAPQGAAHLQPRAAAGSASSATAAALPPVDAERVTQIRQAIQQNRYPVIPARIADAMIAAPFLLNAAKD